MKAKIYKPAKTAMQSGTAATHDWVLEYIPTEKRHQDPLMGWNSSVDTTSQIRLRFATQEDAVEYAKQEGIAFELASTPKTRTLRPKAYADNFSFKRIRVY